MESTAAEAGAPACGDSSGGTSKCRKQRTVSASSSSPPESPDSPGAEGPGRRPASVFKLSASTTPLGSISFFPPSEGHESGLCASPHGALRDPCSDGLNEPSRRRGDCSPFSVDRGALGGAPTCSLFAPERSTRLTLNPFAASEDATGPSATRRAVRRPPDACSGGGVGVLAGGLQDAEIAQLSIREAEEDSALSGFVLGSVIEKNTSSADAHATPAPCPPQAASVAPPSDSYPPGSSGPLSFLPSNAAIEAPFGFPKAVHRSLLPCHSRRGADDNAGTPGGLRPKTGPTGATAASSFSDRGSTSVSGPGAVGKALAAEIENENLHILSRMQPHEIREAREEILQRFGAERFAALQRRALRRARAKCSGEHQEQNGNAEATRGAAAGRAARGERQQLQNEDAARLSAFPRENRTEESQTRLQAGGSAPAASPVPPSSSCASSTQSSVFALPGGRQCVLEWSLEPRRALAAAAARTPAEGRETTFEPAFQGDGQGLNGGVVRPCMQGQSGKDAAQPAGATSSVRFDLQEAAKLQWANPLGLEDARGGPLEEEDGEWEHQRVQGGVFTGVPAKAGRGTKTRIRIERLRFDFDGKLRSEVFPSQVLWSKLCLLRQAGEESLCSALLANSLPDLTREDPLEYHRGLHHHGDEAALAGYTLGELLQLAQSASRPQAALAVRTLGAVLRASRTLFLFPRVRDADLVILSKMLEAAKNADHGERRSDAAVLSSFPSNAVAPPNDGEKGRFLPLLRRLASGSESTCRSAFGVGLPRWRRFVFRDLFLCWRLSSLLQQQTPAVHRAALSALDAALGAPVPEDKVALHGGGEQRERRGAGAQEDSSAQERSDGGDAEVRWRGVVWGGGGSGAFPVFLERGSQTSGGRAHSRVGEKETVARGSQSPASSSFVDAEGADAGGDQARLHPGSEGGRRSRSDCGSERVQEAERMCLYGVGGFDFLEEGDVGFPLLSLTGPAGGEEETTGCGGAFSFWQALSLRVRDTHEEDGGGPEGERDDSSRRRVTFAASGDDSVDGTANSNSREETKEDVSVAELYYRHPIACLLTYSPLLDRLALFLSLYEADHEVERSCLRLLLVCALLGHSAAQQILSHSSLSSRLQHLAESLVVGSSARGLRVQRERSGLPAASALENGRRDGSALSASLAFGDMYAHLLAARKAETAALAARCGTPLTTAERRVALDLLRLLRCLARWGRRGDDDAPLGDDLLLWGDASPAFWAVVNQSMMEGLSVLPRAAGTNESNVDEPQGADRQGAAPSSGDATDAFPYLGASSASVSAEKCRAARCKSPARSASRLSVPAVEGAEPEPFAGEALQLLGAAEALRVVRMAVSRHAKADELTSFFPALSTCVNQFMTSLQQLYGEALLAHLLVDAVSPPTPGNTEQDQEALLLPPEASSPSPQSASARGASRQLTQVEQNADALCVFHGSVAREIFLWAALGLEMRQRKRRKGSYGTPLSGLEGASLLGPVPVIIRLLWQLKPRASRVPPAASLRVAQSALQLAHSSAAAVLRCISPSCRGEDACRTVVNGGHLGGEHRKDRATTEASLESITRRARCLGVAEVSTERNPTGEAERQGPPGGSAAEGSAGKARPTRGLSGGFEPALKDSASAGPAEARWTQSPSDDNAAKAAPQVVARGGGKTRKRVWSRDEELLVFRWLRSSRPIVEAMFCEDCSAFPPPSPSRSASPLRYEEVEGARQQAFAPTGASPCAQLMESIAVTLSETDGRTGADFAARFTAYVVASGWSAVFRCCCGQGRQGGVDAAAMRREATPEKSAQLRESMADADGEVTCWRGVIPATSEAFGVPALPRRDGFFAPEVYEAIAIRQRRETGLEAETHGETEKPGHSRNFDVGAERALPHEIEHFLTEARLLTTVSDFFVTALSLMRHPVSCRASKQSEGGDSPSEGGFSSTVLVSLGAAATTLCRLLRRFLLSLFRRLRWPEHLGQRCLSAAPGASLSEARSARAAKNGEMEGRDCSASPVSFSPSPSPASPPPLRFHEAAVCSGPVLLCDILARLMISLLDFRRVCFSPASGLRQEREAREGQEESERRPDTGWSLREEQECILAACSAASTSHTLFRCIVALYSNTVHQLRVLEARPRVFDSARLASSTIARPGVSTNVEAASERESVTERGERVDSGFTVKERDEWRQKWIAGAALWFTMCFLSDRSLQSGKSSADNGKKNVLVARGGAAARDGVTFELAWRAFAAVSEEIEGRLQADRGEEGDGQTAELGQTPPPVPLCLLLSFDEICSCLPVGLEGAREEEGRGGAQEAASNSSEAVPVPAELPCVPLFSSALDALVGGSLWGALAMDASSGSTSSLPTDSTGNAAWYGQELSFPVASLLCSTPFLAQDLREYFASSLVLSGLLLFYTEPSIAAGVGRLCSAGASSAWQVAKRKGKREGSGDASPAQRDVSPASALHSASPSAAACGETGGAVSRGPLEDLWWLLDVWLLQPLGVASRFGELREGCGAPSADAGEGTQACQDEEEGSGERERSEMPADSRGADSLAGRRAGQACVRFSNAFLAVWTAVSRQGQADGAASVETILSLARGYCMKAAAQETGAASELDAAVRDGDCRFMSGRRLAFQRHRVAVAARGDSHATDRLSSLSSPPAPAGFPLCCAKAQDVLLTRVARLVQRAHSTEDTSDPLLFLLLWLLGFSPDFPVECRRLILSETAVLTLADRTFFLGLGHREPTAEEGSEDLGCGVQRTVREGRQPEARTERQAGDGAKALAGGNGGPERPPTKKAVLVCPTWGVLTPQGGELLGLSEASWWLMRPGGLPLEATEEILTLYRSFVRSRLTHAFGFSPGELTLLPSRRCSFGDAAAQEQGVGLVVPTQGLLTVQALAALVRDEITCFLAAPRSTSPAGQRTGETRGHVHGREDVSGALSCGTAKGDEGNEAQRLEGEATGAQDGSVNLDDGESKQTVARQISEEALREVQTEIARVAQCLAPVFGARSALASCQQGGKVHLDSVVRHLGKAVQGLLSLAASLRDGAAEIPS